MSGKRIVITVDRNDGPTTRDDLVSALRSMTTGIDGEHGETVGGGDTDGDGRGLLWNYAVEDMPPARERWIIRDAGPLPYLKSIDDSATCGVFCRWCDEAREAKPYESEAAARVDVDRIDGGKMLTIERMPGAS